MASQQLPPVVNLDLADSTDNPKVDAARCVERAIDLARRADGDLAMLRAAAREMDRAVELVTDDDFYCPTCGRIQIEE